MIFRHRNANAIVVTAACLALLGLFSSAEAQAPVELLGYWPLNETAFGTAADLSGNGLDGTHENNVIVGVPGAPGFGLGADFDGVTGQILLGPGMEHGLGNLTESFTVMAWINPDNFNSKNRVMGASPNAAWGWGTAGTAGNLQITTFGVKDYTQPVPIVANEWTHAAIVLRSNFDADFYANGEFVGTQSHPTSGNTSNNLFYVGFSSGGGEHFDGQLDEVGVFSGELTEQQIRDAMTMGVDCYDGSCPGGGVPGDFNLDGVVNEADYNILGTNLGAHLDRVVSTEDGDYVRDGRIDLNDFGAFKRDFPAVFAAATGVPEPTTLGLAGLFITGMLVTGRRRYTKRSC